MTHESPAYCLWGLVLINSAIFIMFAFTFFKPQTSRACLVCAVLLLIAGFLLWTEHLAHALGFLPYLLILACPLMHIFMHGSHGGHGHHEGTNRDRKARGDEQ